MTDFNGQILLTLLPEFGEMAGKVNDPTNTVVHDCSWKKTNRQRFTSPTICPPFSPDHCRTYVISLHTPGWCDMLWNDTYHFFLFTRGGPYWQDVKVKGRILFKSSTLCVNSLVHKNEFYLNFVALGFSPFRFRFPGSSSAPKDLFKTDNFPSISKWLS